MLGNFPQLRALIYLAKVRLKRRTCAPSHRGQAKSDRANRFIEEPRTQTIKRKGKYGAVRSRRWSRICA